MATETSGEMLDTTPEARERYYALLRAMTPIQRGRAMQAAITATRRLAVAGIRQRYPDADEHEVQVRLTAVLYGDEIARRLHGQVPGDT